MYFFVREPGADATRAKEHLAWVQTRIYEHKKYMNDSKKNPFAGLPELTNENGNVCYGSCPTQAWSTAIMVQVVDALVNLPILQSQ